MRRLASPTILRYRTPASAVFAFSSAAVRAATSGLAARSSFTRLCAAMAVTETTTGAVKTAMTARPAHRWSAVGR